MSTVLISLIVSLGQGNTGNYTNVTFVPDASPIIVNHPTTVSLPTNYTAFPDVGVAYKFFSNRLTWNAARKQCATEGANLAIVDSFQKINYIMGLTVNPFGIHTGIHRHFDGIEWMSIANNQPLAFIPWKPDANIAAGTGQCVAMWYDGSGVGPWNCGNVLPSVCEIPILRENKTEPQNFRMTIDPRSAN